MVLISDTLNMLAKTFNKTLIKILKKILADNKKC